MPYRPTAGPFLTASTADLVEYLRRRGFGVLLDALTDPSVYMRSGKPNMAAIARLIGDTQSRTTIRFRKMIAVAKEQDKA